jgi:hypothetical protein
VAEKSHYYPTLSTALWGIFCEAFLIFKKYFASAIQDLFSFLQRRLFKFPSSED